MKIKNLILKSTSNDTPPPPRHQRSLDNSTFPYIPLPPQLPLVLSLQPPFPNFSWSPWITQRVNTKKWTSSPVLSGDDLPSRRGLVFTAVTVVTTVPQGITVRSFSILVAGTGEETCHVFNSLGSIKEN